MTNDSDATPRRKTLSVKRPRPVEKAAAPPREAAAPRASHLPHAPRESSSHEPRAGKLFALDDHMRRMQADMDKLGFKKD